MALGVTLLLAAAGAGALAGAGDDDGAAGLPAATFSGAATVSPAGGVSAALAADSPALPPRKSVTYQPEPLS